MKYNEFLTQEEGSASRSINYIKILKILWSRWYWVAGSIAIALLFCYVYLWYTPSLYATSGSIKFNDKDPQISGLVPKNSSLDNSSRIQAETYVIQSREVILNAINQVDYEVSFFLEGRVRTSELYPFQPFQVTILQKDSLQFYTGLIGFQKLDAQTFNLKWQGTEKRFRFGEKVEFPGIAFSISKADIPDNANYLFKFNRKEDFLGRIASKLSMREAAKSSNVLLVSLADNNPVFAADVLNALLNEYIRYDLAQKRISGDQTIAFIDSQLDFMNQRVETSGSELEQFKQKRKILNPSTNSSSQMDKAAGLQEQLTQLKLEEIYIRQLEAQIGAGKTFAYNMDLEGRLDALLANLIGELNASLGQRQKAAALYNENSPPLLEIDRQIQTLKTAIIRNIAALKERNRKNQDFYQNEVAKVNQALYQIPADEKDFVNLKSNFETDQAVFQLLNQKKLEAQISRAAVVPGAVLVEKANVNSRAISPVPTKIYTYGLFGGLAFSMLLVIIVRLLNPYIHDKATVESITQVPIIGLIRKFPAFIDQNNSQALSLQQPKSVFAESVRSVRTNLSFLAGEQSSKIICITSEVSGEGKSFVSLNLASTLALIDKKVILIAADLRKSKLHKAFGVENNKGLSTYLSGIHSLNEVIRHSSDNKLDYITSGTVPPNPSELLHSQKVPVLLEELRQTYDFILIDTAPVGLVSDAIPLIRQSDINAFIIRAGVSQFNAATIPAKLDAEYRLKNVVIILNAFDDEILHSSIYTNPYKGSNYTYYYYADYNGYGDYGYFEDKKKLAWWQLWSRFKKNT
jgi:tyrosine-protein kinase Etk/Wzc